MYIECKTPVQNDAQKTRVLLTQIDWLVANGENGSPNAVVCPSWKRAYLTLVGALNLKAYIELKSCTWAWEECQHLTYGVEAFLSKWYRRFPWSPTALVWSLALGTVGSHLLLLRRYGWSDLHSFNIYETLAM